MQAICFGIGQHHGVGAIGDVGGNVGRAGDHGRLGLGFEGSDVQAAQSLTQAAYFAGGCFWGVEDRLQQVPGVIDAISGYQAGKGTNPTYEQVCTHTSGFAETVKVVFDPAKVTYKDLLVWFFKIHDPTQLNRQGPDVGDNYRSAIYADSDEQLAQVRAFIDEQSKTERFKSRKIVTQVAKVADVGQFYAAEDYHQDYHAKHGGSCPLPND